TKFNPRCLMISQRHITQQPQLDQLHFSVQLSNQGVAFNWEQSDVHHVIFGHLFAYFFHVTMVHHTLSDHLFMPHVTFSYLFLTRY
ncbi:hypothetical protein ACJX0J_011495, partial [Zea mays]